MNELQRLREAHGTPKEFAQAVWRALGEVSVAEAQAAIEKYERQWCEAEQREAIDAT